MKKLALVFLLACLIADANAQSKEEKKVAASVEALRKAMVDADSLVLDRLVEPGLNYGHSSGKIEDKASFISSITTGSSDFASIDLTDQKITIRNRTATVRHILSAKTNDRGVSGTVKLAVLLVWVREGKTWKLLARQAIKA